MKVTDQELRNFMQFVQVALILIVAGVIYCVVATHDTMNNTNIICGQSCVPPPDTSGTSQ